MGRQGQPGPHSMVQASLSYLRPCLKRSKRNTTHATLQVAICPHHDSTGKRLLPHFTDKEAEAQDIGLASQISGLASVLFVLPYYSILQVATLKASEP